MSFRLPHVGSAIQSALILGFGFTLSLWMFSAYDFNVELQSVRRQTDAIDDRYERAQDSLSKVRRRILASGVQVRRMFLASDLEAFKRAQERLDRSLGSADEALQDYQALLEGGTPSPHLSELQAGIQNVYRLRRDVLTDDLGRLPRPARLPLLDRAGPDGTIAARISREIQEVTRDDLARSRSDVAALYTVLLHRQRVQVGITLAMSVLFGLVATWRASRLEQGLIRQRETVAANARDLQRLSGELMTAQEEERRKIARELHDEIGQTLTAIKVDLAGLEQAVSGTDVAPLLAGSRALAEGALRSVRHLSRLLHPSLLDDLGLPAAVDAQAREFSRRHVPCAVSCTGLDDRLQPEIEVAAYRIVQEALCNVAKHAQATACYVTLTSTPTAFSISVEDDGLGFEPATGHRLSGGLGLIAIRERAAALGGVASIHSAPGEGTRLTIDMPLQAASFVVSSSPAFSVDASHREVVHA